VLQVLLEAQGAGDAAGPPSYRPSSARAVPTTALQPGPRGHVALMRKLYHYLAVTRGRTDHLPPKRG